MAYRDLREFVRKLEKEGELTADEKAELDHFLDLEHILRMAKARARQILSGGQ